jgi:amino acid transporter
VLVGLFYVFNMYAATVFFGPDRMGDFLAANEGDPWGGMATEVLGTLGGLLVIFAILNSCVANANASATAATRSLFAMGRATLISRWFAAVHPEFRSPVNAVHFQAILGIVVAIALGLVLANDPFEGAAGLNVYVWLGTLVGLLFAAMYIAVNVACIGYFLRERRDEFNVIKHLIVPILGVIAMIPAVLAVIGGVTIPVLDVTIPAYENSLQWTAPVVGIWLVLGIAAYFVLRSRNPTALARMNEVYGGEDAPSDA